MIEQHCSFRPWLAAARPGFVAVAPIRLLIPIPMAVWEEESPPPLLLPLAAAAAAAARLGYCAEWIVASVKVGKTVEIFSLVRANGSAM
jgi:hypothetical protein